MEKMLPDEEEFRNGRSVFIQKSILPEKETSHSLQNILVRHG